MRLSCAVLLLSAVCVSAQQRTVSDAEVERVHRSILLIDTHNDITSRTVDGFDIGSHATDTQTDIQRLRAGNVGAHSSPCMSMPSTRRLTNRLTALWK